MMMPKEKIFIEYVFDNASIKSIWDYVSTPHGLGEWFAEKVVKKDENIFSFYWDKTPQDAEIVDMAKNKFIRFRWTEEKSEAYYFEFSLRSSEITGDIVLDITDFSLPEEKNESVELWESQIKTLRRILGI